MRLTDGVTAVLGKLTGKRSTRGPKSKFDIRANVEVTLRDEFGNIKFHERGENLVTDYGDEHIANRIFDDAQDIVTGMRLGTGSTAASKSGAGAAIVTYISGSQEALDAAATESDLGGGSGHRVIHVCTWVAGDVTNSAIAEVVLTDETPLTDVAGVAGNTVARFVFGSTIDKQVGDSLEVTWNIDILGA
jgi:hypothetical protein